ncbi:MAG: NAD-dependent epimerase/dehydratase family protein, partial [Gemmatimonadota bacterium]|nr:NAD-dependent epimerase/dehydratase family protein [Gemmatimonadota bacterium]
RTFGLDRPGLPHPPELSEAVDFDVTDQASIDAALSTVRRDGGDRVASVVHLAAYYDFSGEPSDLYDKVTVRGTERLLESLQRLGIHVGQFLFSSTMLVHAPGRPGDRITEDAPLEATWDYPKSKIDTERVMRDRRGGIPVVMLRLAGVYTDDCQSIPIAHQIQRIYERDLTSHVFPGDTDAGQSFVHLDDAVGAIRLCVDRRGELPPVLPLLVGEEDVLSYRDLQHALGELIHGKEWHTLRVPKLVAKAGAYVQEKLPGGDPFIKPWMIDLADDHYALDISRARNLLGWAPRRSRRDTLPAMVAALKADPAAWYRENKLQPPDSVQEGRPAPPSEESHAS